MEWDFKLYIGGFSNGNYEIPLARCRRGWKTSIW